MDIVKLIFTNITNVVVNCFNLLDKDFFGIGFTFLDLMLAVVIVCILIHFLTGGRSALPSLSIMGDSHKVLGSISNYNRKQQIITEYSDVYKDDKLVASSMVKHRWNAKDRTRHSSMIYLDMEDE